MLLAIANAQAQAVRVSEEHRASARAARDVQALLGLSEPPERIECFDISHDGAGGHTVASRVVFVKGQPAKELYRSYSIRSAEQGDDYGGIREVISRRFRVRDMREGRGAVAGPGEAGVEGEVATGGARDVDAAEDAAEAWPDVVVIDGGKGQLAAALAGLEDAGVRELEHLKARVCALAKRREEVFVANRSRPLVTDPDQPALLLLRALRDESHRFALSRLRRLRSKALFQ